MHLFADASRHMIKERLKALRAEMAQRNIAIYVVPTSDFHESEYVGEYFKARKFITGFTGSAGTAVITMEEAGLWTDGRYFIQAAHQLEGSGVTLFKMGEEGVPTVNDYIESKLPQKGCIGFDGRVIHTRLGAQLQQICEAKEGQLHVTEDLIDLIWQDRPMLSKAPAYVLDLKYAGESTASKLSRLREAMIQTGATVHILSDLTDIAWLLNIRGNDINSVPVVLSYAVITLKDCYWFAHEEVLNEGVKAHLVHNHITFKNYEDIYSFLPQLSREEVVLLDPTSINYRMTLALPKDTQVISGKNPTQLMKAIKNPIELDNIRACHIKDGVAVTQFMYWLKNTIGKEKITEISASDYLEARRREQEGFIELSFDTISAYGANAAMMHYFPTEASNTELQPEGFLLVDSGGHYFEGSTDITRTFALGSLTEKQKLHFTAIVRSNLNLAAAKFLEGCNGQNLDILSRGPIWEMGLDYKCGTGHGIGYLLNVHEAPNGFRWRLVPERNDSSPFVEGMVTTDEPGIYLEGEYGIRTENELICLKGEKNEYGQFMYFENITYAPIDLDAILPEAMSVVEKQRLNDYHEMVYTKVSPYLNEAEKTWLKHYTRAI